MERTFWVLMGLGVCATSLTVPIEDTLEIFYLFFAIRVIFLGIGIRNRLEELIEIVEEEEEQGIYHEPYDISEGIEGE